MASMNGYDIFFEKPGEVQFHRCRVCGTICSVDRDQKGPTSWAGAMAHKQTPHDFFYCPHGNESWHQKALDLVQEMGETRSKRVVELIRQDLKDLLREHGIQNTDTH